MRQLVQSFYYLNGARSTISWLAEREDTISCSFAVYSTDYCRLCHLRSAVGKHNWESILKGLSSICIKKFQVLDSKMVRSPLKCPTAVLFNQTRSIYTPYHHDCPFPPDPSMIWLTTNALYQVQDRGLYYYTKLLSFYSKYLDCINAADLPSHYY